MKILHVINSLSMGGAEKLIAETLPLIEKSGVKVELLLLNGTDAPLLKDVKDKGITVYHIGSGSVYNLAHIFRIIPFLKKNDLVHVHLFPSQYFVALAKLLSGSKTKLVFTEHSTKNRRMEMKYFKVPEKIIYAQYDKIICITEEVKAVLKSHTSLSDDKLIVVENGINTDRIKEACPLKRSEVDTSLKETDVLLVQVSGFRVGKDQKTVIKALKYLPDQFKLILVGDGITRAEHELLVAELELNKRVFFLGVRNDIPQLLKTADIAILSSQYEGLSLASLEGMASGKPFIGSDVPGIRELVKGYGVLFPQGKENKLAEEILKLTQDKDYYHSVAEACKKRASQYDISSMVNKTVNLYNKIIK